MLPLARRNLTFQKYQLCNMQIYEILEKDLKTCAQLHKESFEKSWSETEFLALFSNPHVSGLYLAEKNKIIGFVLYLHILDDAEIYTMCICPTSRKNGYASLLLEALKTRLLDRCVSRIFLEVSEDNHAAQTLYHKNSYKIFDRRKNYYTHGQKNYDALIMQYLF